MTQSINKDRYTTLITQVMDIDDVTWGDPRRDYLVRYRGLLKTDKIAAKTLLTDALAGDKLAPIIRTEDGRDSILLISDPITTIVAQVFDIQDSTWAPTDQIHLVRFLGKLTVDSMEAYDFLQSRLEPRDLDPSF